MKDFILNIDHQLFTFLNGLHSKPLDFVMYWFSDRFFWIPLYAFLLGSVIYHYRKKAVLLIIVTAALVASTDQVSRSFKYGVERYRPCRPESNHLPEPHLIKNHCGGKYSFFSAHASNTFGIAMFFGSLLTPLFKRSKQILLFWAVIVAYSRIHLGVHYPLDIFCGALCGLLFGWIYTKISFKYFKLQN